MIGKIVTKIDNFSYNVIEEDDDLEIPENQQMIVYQQITLNGDLILTGDLVLIG